MTPRTMSGGGGIESSESEPWATLCSISSYPGLPTTWTGTPGHGQSPSPLVSAGRSLDGGMCSQK